MILLAFKLLHLLFAATWFGTGLTLVGDARRTLALGPPHLGPLFARLRRVTIIMLGSAALSLAFGFGLIFARGGFKFIAVRYHIGLSLSLVAGVLTFLMSRVAAKMAAIGEQGDMAQLVAQQKRLAMLSGMFQLLWTVILFLMIFPVLQPQ